MPQIAGQAASAFADLVKRAAARALKAGGAAGADALNQFVDLRFMPKSAGLPLPQAALDEAMAALFPLVAAAAQKQFDAAPGWDEKLQVAEDLAELQASATQAMNEPQANAMGASFDSKASQLEQLADAEAGTETRTAMLEGLARARKSRDDRITDAKANNLNVVAALLQGKTETDAGFRAPSEVDVPEEPPLARARALRPASMTSKTLFSCTPCSSTASTRGDYRRKGGARPATSPSSATTPPRRRKDDLRLPRHTRGIVFPAQMRRR